uniref:Uncharacterized protein n=1 Tax=Oryza brachyantha TaxID=4533 RepID=J3MZ38_ORYBR
MISEEQKNSITQIDAQVDGSEELRATEGEHLGFEERFDITGGRIGGGAQLDNNVIRANGAEHPLDVNDGPLGDVRRHEDQMSSGLTMYGGRHAGTARTGAEACAPARRTRPASSLWQSRGRLRVAQHGLPVVEARRWQRERRPERRRGGWAPYHGWLNW